MASVCLAPSPLKSESHLKKQRRIIWKVFTNYSLCPDDLLYTGLHPSLRIGSGDPLC